MDKLTTMPTSDSLFFEYYTTWSDSYKPLLQSRQISAMFANDLLDLQLLIKSGESVNVTDEYGNTPLHIAASKENSEVFDYLLTLENVKIDAQNIHGFTPLHIALYEHNENKALKLIEKGADINAVTDIGCTPLHYAACVSEKVGNALLEKGAEIDVRNSFGQTPLYIACRSSNCCTIGMLLYYGADVNIPDNEGVSPFHLVLERCAEYWHEIFFYYTFDQEKIPVHLSILTEAMKEHSPWFMRIVEKTSQVVYDENNLVNFYEHLRWTGNDFFHVFLNNFEYVVQDMFALCTSRTSLKDYLSSPWAPRYFTKYQGKPYLVNKSGQVVQEESENILSELICY